MTVGGWPASVDGAIGPAEHARIGVQDDGLLRGDGAFEVIRLYGGRPFARADHLQRLARSAAVLQLGYDAAAVETELDALLASAGPRDAQLRIVLTRAGRRVMIVEPLPEGPRPVRLAHVPFALNGITDGVKSLSYAPNMQASRLARAARADEAVLVSFDDVVLEAPTASVFWVSAGGRLRTPATELGLLESITRARLCEALAVEQGAFALADLRGAREAFLASTTREVMPVSAVDGHALGACPGPRTVEAAQAFDALVARELDRDPPGRG